MQVVTRDVKVELTAEESSTLRCAKSILQNFAEIMKDNNCRHMYFEDLGVEYCVTNLEYMIDLLDAFGEDDPTIK